jgi:single-strand DNA-binding protein
MARKQNPEQPVGEVIAESATVKSRSFGTCRFAILGRVAADPALRYTAGGKAVLDLTLATTAAGVASFHTVVCWERVAETLAQYAGKGRELYVDGRLGSRVREVEGHRIKQVDLVVENFQLLGRPLTASADTGEEPAVEGAA